MYLNKAFLYGNLTRDPELKSLPSGQNVASFSLATNRSFKGKDGQQQEQTEFHNVVAFGRQADIIAQYVKKGRPLYVEGRIQTRSWEKDGKKEYRTEVVMESFQFGPQGEEGRTSAPRPAAPRASENTASSLTSIQYPDEEINPEDIPF